jgi:hypothetical protein
MAQSVVISRRDIHDFLARKGFSPITLPGTREAVYGKVVRKASEDATGRGVTICLRVYTSVEGDQTRDNGKDAIRCVLVAKIDDAVKIIGGDRRVHRVVGWRGNLESRLDNWEEMLGPSCPSCGCYTIRNANGRRGPFWGCCRYPVCRGLIPMRIVRATRPAPVAVPASQPDDEFYSGFDYSQVEDRD